MLQKAYAFGYLHKEHQKEIKILIEKKGKEVEATINYREKLWTESLDMVNNNLIKMYYAQGDTPPPPTSGGCAGHPTEIPSHNH